MNEISYNLQLVLGLSVGSSHFPIIIPTFGSLDQLPINHGFNIAIHAALVVQLEG